MNIYNISQQVHIITRRLNSPRSRYLDEDGSVGRALDQVRFFPTLSPITIISTVKLLVDALQNNSEFNPCTKSILTRLPSAEQLDVYYNVLKLWPKIYGTKDLTYTEGRRVIDAYMRITGAIYLHTDLTHLVYLVKKGSMKGFILYVEGLLGLGKQELTK